MGARRIAAIASFGLCAGALAVSLLTFPWKKGDTVTSTYVIAVAAGSAALTWGIALVVPRWRRFAVSFAVVTTIYAGLMAWVFIRLLPACASGSRPPPTP